MIECTYNFSSRVQRLSWRLDFACAGLEWAYRHGVDDWIAIVEHSRFIEILRIYPLQGYDLRRHLIGCIEVVHPFELQPEPVIDVASGMQNNALRVPGIGPHKVCPMILERRAVEHEKLH